MTATERGPSSFAMPRPGGATPPGSGEDWMPEEPGEELLADDAAVDLDAERAESRVDEVLDELDRELVGLVAVKTRIREIAALLLVDRLRNRFGLASSRPTLHMCFTGPPGTGKTTVAMRLARLLSNLGYLTSGHLVTATRDDLVGQYVGHTAPKTREVLKRAMGGVLFIDEAYYLYRAENERDYGQEAIEILLQVMEAQREDVVVVLAGYKDRMDTFFQSNPGMHSRIAHHIDFPNYTLDELDAIGHLMLAKERYELSEEAEVIFREYLSRRMRQPRFANARSVRNALERARLRQANRLMNRSGTLTKADLVRIEADDFRASRVFDDGDDFVETGAGPAQGGGGARGGGTRGGSGARRRSPKAVTGDGGAEAQAQRTVRPPKRPAARPVATQAPARSRAAGE